MITVGSEAKTRNCIGAVARMERSVIRDCREASMPPRITLRSIRATLACLLASVGWAKARSAVPTSASTQTASQTWARFALPIPHSLRKRLRSFHPICKELECIPEVRKSREFLRF